MQNLLVKLRHIYKNTLPDQPSDFSINVINLLCEQANNTKNKFSPINFYSNPTSFLTNVSKQLQKTIQQLQEQYLQEQNKPSKLFSLKNIQQQNRQILQRKKYNIRMIMAHIPYTKQIYKNFRDISSIDVGNWIIVTGTVIQSTQKKALQKAKYFRCTQCKSQFQLECQYHNSYRFQFPNSCTNMVQKQKPQNFISKIYQNFQKKKNQTLPKQKQKQQPTLKTMKCGSNKFQPIEDNHKKVCIDYQQLKVQQPFKHILSGKLPQTITVLVQGISFDQYRPGDDVTISGMLDYRFKKLIKDTKVQSQLIIFANNITISKQNRKQKQQEEQRTQFSDNPKGSSFPFSYLSQGLLGSKDQIIIKQLKFRKEVLRSFCPTIYERDIPKLAIILALLGGVNYETENTKIRGQSHVLLVGQPGTGKSVLLQAAAQIAERSFMTNGIGTTSAGLSVSYFKEGGDWTIEAGALVLADNGVCCIDQLTLLSKKDEKSLLEAMQQQTISSAKASVVGKLNARTTIIAACNPITPHQKYDQNESLQTNTGLSIPLLTRFDLIIILKDDHQTPQDIKKCDYILDKFMITQDHQFNLPYQRIIHQAKPSQSQLSRETNLKIKSLFKKCKIFTPQLAQQDIIKSYYTQQRKKTEKVTTVRTFQSLCRLTQAHAKLMMRDTTTQFDCVSAIMLMENRIATTIQQYHNYLDQFNDKFHTNFKY